MIRLFALIVTLLIAVPASAQDMEQWEDFLRRGSEAYDAEEYETALLLYGKAQDIVDAPRLRLQIADIHELLSECNAARLIYVKLLDDQEVEDEVRKIAAERLEELSNCANEADNGPDEFESPGEPGTDQAQLTQSPREPEPEGRRRLPPGRKRLGITLVSFGGTAVVAGVLFARATFLPSEVKQCLGIAGVADCGPYSAKIGARYTYDARDQAETVRRRHVVATATLLAVGIAAAGTGLVVLTTGKRPVAVLPMPGGAQLIARF